MPYTIEDAAADAKKVLEYVRDPVDCSLRDTNELYWQMRDVADRLTAIAREKVLQRMR